MTEFDIIRRELRIKQKSLEEEYEKRLIDADIKERIEREEFLKL